MKLRRLLLMAAVFGFLQSGFQIASAQNAKVQIIHNAPDPALSNIDVWIDTMKVLSEFKFRNATKFMELPGNTLMQLRIKPAGSTDTTAPMFRKAINLGSGQNYYVVAYGLMDSTLYTNPNGISTKFDIDFIPDARDTSQVSGNMQFKYRHGIPDYDSMNVRIAGQLNYLVEPQLYRQVSDWVTVPPALYTFTAYRGMGYDEVFNFQVLLSNFADSALFFMSSGLFASTIDTNLPHMGVMVITSGGRQAFYEGFVTSLKESLNAPGWAVYPNPVSGSRIQVKAPASLNAMASVELIDGQGRVVQSRSVPVRNGAMAFEKGNVSEGLYLLKVQAKGELFTTRLKL